MNTKSKSKAISIGIAVIMMVSLFAVMSVSASVVTDCWIGDDDKVYFTVYSGEKVDRANGLLHLNGAYSGEHRMFSLNAGETKTLSFSYIWNGVDDVEVRNDVDDDCCNPIQPTPTPTPTPTPGMPDLTVTYKAETFVDGEVIIHYTITNIGDAMAGASTAGKYLNEHAEDTDSVPRLGPGASYDGTFDPEPCPSGETITVRVCADIYEVVDESDETNNCMTNTFECPLVPPPEMPDLIVSEKWETFEYNGQIVVHFTIENIGDADARSSTACKYINDIEVDTVSVPALGAGTSFTGAFDPEDCAPDTTFEVTVCADNYNVVVESDETNNCMTNEFTCEGPQQGGPDLVVEKEVEIFESWNDCFFNVRVTVTNIGNEPARGSDAGLLVNGEFVDDAFTEGLGLGASDEVWFNWVNCPCGDPINITVCADYYNVVEESNEDNNCVSNIRDCNVAEIEAFKEVLDPVLGWVDERNANFGDNNVRFRCRIHNDGCCCDLSAIEVTDMLSPSLEYVGMIVGPVPDITNYADGRTGLRWQVPGPLEPGDWLPPFVIQTRVIAHGTDTNTLFATATADCTGESVESDRETATVNVAPAPGIRVTKQVRRPFGPWVAPVINVPVAAVPAPVEFRCVVENIGSTDLTNIDVWDDLTWGLWNINAWVPGDPSLVPVITAGVLGTIVEWSGIPGPLEPGDRLVFRIDADETVPTVGNWDTNIQRARAWSAETGTWVFDWDVVVVNVV